MRAPFDRILERHGLTLPHNYVETLSNHLARAYLQMTNAIGVLPGGAASRDASQPLHVLPLALPRLMIRPVGVMWNKSRSLTPAAQMMVTCLEEAAGQIAQSPKQTVEIGSN